MRHRFTRAALILLYHRVSSPERDPYALCVEPERFAEQLEVLRRRSRPMSLDSLVYAAQTGTLPRRSVAVTFDDGYVDNLTNALPLLAKFDIPATVFIATGLLGTRREFWWDELERIVLEPGSLPGEFDLTIAGERVRVSLKGDAAYSRTQLECDRGWTLRDKPGTARHTLFSTLYQRLLPMVPEQRELTMTALRSWSGVPEEGRTTHALLDDAGVTALRSEKLISVGAHSVTHPQLTKLNPAAQKNEIEQSRRTLTKILGQAVPAFSYPHGAYSTTTSTLVRGAGFSYACGSDADVVRPGHDTFGLPRLVAGNWDGDRFSDWLDGCLGC